MLHECHLEALSVKSLEDGVKKLCAFKGDDYKEYHHKTMRCVLEKGKEVPKVKELEDKKKNNKEEFKKEKRELMMKGLTCEEQVLGIH